MDFSRESIATYCPSTVPLRTALWHFKQDLQNLRKLEKGDPYTFASQQQQWPPGGGGCLFKDKYWRHYDVLPAEFDLIRIYGDTAQKTKEANDYSVFQCWGRLLNKGIFLIDQCRGKWEAPELESTLVEFWEKHRLRTGRTGAQCVMIEDKSSGSSLIQSIQRDYTIPIEGIQRNTDKVLRAMGVIKFFASGHVFLPKNAEWLHDYKEEFRKFTPLMTHRHDDQIDPTMDAVENLLIFEEHIYTWASLA